MSGNIYEFDLRGRANGENIVARGKFVRRFESEYAWMNARTPQAKLAIGVDADSVSAMGFAFDTVNARVTYTPRADTSKPRRRGEEPRVQREGRLRAVPESQGSCAWRIMTFRFDTAFWSMPRPASIRWGGRASSSPNWSCAIEVTGGSTRMACCPPKVRPTSGSISWNSPSGTSRTSCRRTSTSRGSHAARNVDRHAASAGVSRDVRAGERHVQQDDAA